MTLSAGSVSLAVKGDANGFGKRLASDLTKEARSSGLANVGKIIGGTVLAGVGLAMAGIGAVLHTGIQETLDASAGTAQLVAGIKSTGNAAGVTVGGLQDLASSIQNMSGQTDDSIVSTEQLLLTFRNIKNVGADKIFDDATLAAANMAAKMGGDASSKAILLGKALNDPVKGITALTRVGVSFTQAQKDSIKAMVDAGNTAGAQKIILGELATEFGGAAEAAGKSLPGQLAIAKRSFEDVSQSITEKLLPIVLPALLAVGDVITKNILPAVDDFIQGIKDGTGVGGTFRDIFDKVKDVLGKIGAFVRDDVVPALKDFGDWFTVNALPKLRAFGDYITKTLIPAISDVIGWVKQNKDWLSALAVGIGAVVLAMKLYQGAMAVWKGVQIAAIAIQTAWNVVMAANPVGIIVLAIASLVAGLVYFFGHTETGKRLWAAFTHALSVGWDAIKNAFIAGYNTVKSWLGKAFDFIKKVWSYTPLGLITGNWDKIMTFFKGIPDKLKAGLTKVSEFISAPFRTAFNFIADGWNKTVGKLSFKAPSWVPGIGGKGWDVPDIPRLAEGATILPTPGGTTVRVAEAGVPESVVDTGKLNRLIEQATDGGSARQVVNNWNISGVVDPGGIALAVSRRQSFAGA